MKTKWIWEAYDSDGIFGRFVCGDCQIERAVNDSCWFLTIGGRRRGRPQGYYSANQAKREATAIVEHSCTGVI